MKSGFNAPASAAAAAAGNGWYILYNHRGREKTHTFQPYLRQKTQTENIPAILNSKNLSGPPEASKNCLTVGQWAGLTVTPQWSARGFDQPL